MEKQTLRSQILEMRNSMDSADREYLNGRLSQRILALEKIQKAETVMCYVSFGSEADTCAIISGLWDMGKKVAVPRVCGEDMSFYFINDIDELVPGYKGIPEPNGKCTEFIPSKGNVIIVPGTVFDERLFRIGYGKGFYDRYLEKHKGLYGIGICYDFQVVEAIPIDKWDRGLDIIVTEKRKITY